MDCVQIWGHILSGTLEDLTEEQYALLNAHKGHHLELVKYADSYYAIECTTCHEVLFDDELL